MCDALEQSELALKHEQIRVGRAFFGYFFRSMGAVVPAAVPSISVSSA